MTPLLVALVNGLAPLVFSLLILVSLWLASYGAPQPLSPLYGAILVALVLLFFLGRITDISWLRSGLKTLLVAVVPLLLYTCLRGTKIQVRIWRLDTNAPWPQFDAFTTSLSTVKGLQTRLNMLSPENGVVAFLRR